MSDAWPRIPYGMADFGTIRRERFLYVDKTRFLRPLEEERYAFLIRPRRFGKTCWLSVLENYYDRGRAGDFEAVFGGTDIGRGPTPNRHRYVVLWFDFSAFGDTLATLEQRFEVYCDTVLFHALGRHPDLFPEAVRQRILSRPSIDTKLNELFQYAGDRSIALYVLIDEYDNFANTVLAHHGEKEYEALTHGGGFYRNFFATLKAGTTRGGSVERMFITGVSPIAMDDVASGFNIGRNISLNPRFDEMLGFTEAEVRGLLETYRRHGVFDRDTDEALEVMREWYDGYRFARTPGASVYNTDMVLYYLKASIPNEPGPDNLIDDNVRIDYGKLRHFLVVNRRASAAEAELNGNFDLLRGVIAEGRAETAIRTSFPVKRLARRENFLSLLYFFGLLGIRGAAPEGAVLGIPNQTVRQLMYGFLRDAFDDAGLFSTDPYRLHRLLGAMACRGEWRPMLDYLRDALARQTGIRDYIDGEKFVQAFLAMHFGLTHHFLIHPETELNFGYADLYLEPFAARHPDIRYGYVIELKYLRREGTGGEGIGGGAETAAALDGAKAQLRRYLADGALRGRHPSVRHVGLAVVFRGWELAAAEEVRTAP